MAAITRESLDYWSEKQLTLLSGVIRSGQYVPLMELILDCKNYEESVWNSLTPELIEAKILRKVMVLPETFEEVAQLLKELVSQFVLFRSGKLDVMLGKILAFANCCAQTRKRLFNGADLVKRLSSGEKIKESIIQSWPGCYHPLADLACPKIAGIHAEYLKQILRHEEDFELNNAVREFLECDGSEVNALTEAMIEERGLRNLLELPAEIEGVRETIRTLVEKCPLFANRSIRHVLDKISECLQNAETGVKLDVNTLLKPNPDVVTRSFDITQNGWGK